MKTISITTMLTGMALLVFSASYAGKPVKGAAQAPILNGQTQSVQATTAYQVQTQLTKVWNGSAWVNSDKETYTYNSKGLLIYDLDQADTIANTWYNNASDTFAYDGQNRLISHISTTLDTVGTTLIYALKTTSSFNGNIDTATGYSWIGSWASLSRDIIYMYNGYDTLDINQGFIDSAHTWLNSQKTDSILNSKGQDSLSYISTWQSGKWYITDKYRYYYDGHGNDTLYIHLHGDSINDLTLAFEQEQKYTYNGNQITQIIQNGSYNGSLWFPMAKLNYFYDANGNDTQTTEDTGSNGWSNYLKYSFTYTTLTGIGANNFSAQDINLCIYPNPFTSQTTIEATIPADSPVSLAIYDITGCQITAKNNINHPSGQFTYTFDAKKYNCQSGIYIIKLTLGSEVITRQIIRLP